MTNIQINLIYWGDPSTLIMSATPLLGRLGIPWGLFTRDGGGGVTPEWNVCVEGLKMYHNEGRLM